jgi:tetratricopeptide (TPR) repeat protein
MKTLYDLLGALADDDAESLRTAFRKAAKATHPDLNAGDPDAPLRFRQIFRAHAILSDPEQRAAYDWLLASEVSQPGSQLRPAVIYHTIHKLASGVIAFTILAVVLVGGYTLFGHISKASVIPAEVTEVATPAPAEITAVAATPQPDAEARDKPADRLERVEVPSETTVSGAASPLANTGSAEATGTVASVPDYAVKDATTYRERGIVAYRGGDLRRAIADFDRAIKLDPNYADAYVDRGIAFYRSGEFDRAFADMAQAKHIRNARRARHQASASSGRN